MSRTLPLLGETQANRVRISHFLWVVTDILVVIGAYTVAYLGRTLIALRDFIENIEYVFMAAILASLFLRLNGVYRRIWNQSGGHEVKVLIFACFETALLVTIIDFIPATRPLPLSVIWMANLLSLVAFTSLRYRSRLISGLKWRWKAVWWAKFPEEGEIPARVLVVGAGKSGQLFVGHSLTLGSKNRLFLIIGFADDDASKQRMLVEGKPVLGRTADIPSIVREHAIDLIVLAMHNISTPDFRRIVDICQTSEAQIKVMPDVFGTVTKAYGANHLRNIRIEDVIGRSSVPFEAGIDRTPIENKVILVTGAAGSVGSELSRQLAKCNPSNLLLLDNNESGLFDIQKELEVAFPKLNFTVLLCDVTDTYATKQVFLQFQPQVVFHAAAYKHVPLLENHPYEAVRNNIGGTLNIAQLSQSHDVERFLLISSDKAVNSTSVMGATKYICEQLVRSLAEITPTATTLMTIVRFGNVVGSRGSVVPLFEKQIDAGGPITVTDEHVTRYFMSIPEAAHLVIQAACMTTGGELYILEMGERVRIVELAERMIRLRGLRPYKDIEIIFTGLRPGEELHEQLLIQGEIRQATHHPHIFAIVSPPLETKLFFEESKHLLNGTLRVEPEKLNALVRNLAHETQQKYQEKTV